MNGVIPSEAGEVPSDPTIRRWMGKKRDKDKAEADGSEPARYPHSFRPRKRKIDVLNEKTKEVETREVELPPLLPEAALPSHMHLLRYLNERGFERPSVRFVRNYHELRQVVPVQERTDDLVIQDAQKAGLPATDIRMDALKLQSQVDDFLVAAACVLSYADTVEEHEEVYEYVEYAMAYQAWKPFDEEAYQLFKEAQRGKEQVVGSIKSDLSDHEATPGAARTYWVDVDGPTRARQIPGVATFTQMPKPELVMAMVETDEKRPGYGETIYQAFFHPTMENSLEAVERFKNKEFGFRFPLEPIAKVEAERALREKA